MSGLHDHCDTERLYLFKNDLGLLNGHQLVRITMDDQRWRIILGDMVDG